MKATSFVKTISDYGNTFLAASWLEGRKVCLRMMSVAEQE